VRNYLTIFQGFRAMEIPMDAILPRQNVFTYGAWQQLGYQVTRGSTGVRVQTWRRITRPQRNEETGEMVQIGGLIPKWTSVFHESQVAAREDVPNPTPLPVPLEASNEEIEAIRVARNVADHSQPLEAAPVPPAVERSAPRYADITPEPRSEHEPVIFTPHAEVPIAAPAPAPVVTIQTEAVEAPMTLESIDFDEPVSSHQPAPAPAPTPLPQPMQQRRPRVVWAAPSNIQALEDYYR
jgi:hypothetical protein